ncbi:MAG TPA: hypothetical protein VME21_03975, partial [Steroidobacteraceae bacterium]|nr:hypothetical protein [Steroidobacteraceae bacterium]
MLLWRLPWACVRAPPLLAAAAVVLSACTTVEASAAAQRSPSAADLAAAVLRLSAADVNSPVTLAARLDYAEFLLADSASGSCERRLAEAQSQLAALRVSHGTDVLFPRGWARLVDGEYRLHRLSASCAPDGQAQTRELRAAVAAAASAVGLYRDSLDYHSMAAMQFNVAALDEQLGEHGAALEALTSAIAMDREFGFREDARENYAYLLRLRGQPADHSQVAAQLRDFPERSVGLTFAWTATDARVLVRSERTRLVAGAILKSEVQSELQRGVRRHGAGWRVSYQMLSASDAAGVWPRPPSIPGLEDAVFSPMLLQHP